MVETTTAFIANDLILKRFIAEWEDRTIFTFENSQFTPPGLGIPGDTSDVAAWTRVVVRGRESFQETIGATGNRKFQRKSEVFIQIFVPIDTGTGEANTLAQAAREIFEGVKLNGDIHFGAGIVEPIGVSDRWFQVNVTVPFDYWETK